MRITQKDLKKYVANGGDLWYLSKKQRAAIPQEVVDQYVANGGSLFYFSKKQRADISREAINQYVAKGGDLRDLTGEQIAAIPEQILEISENAREALTLYRTRLIKSSKLPSDVFVNYEARQCLLGIIKQKITMDFAELCEDRGYVKSGVPEEVQMAFDEKLEQIGQEVDERMRSGVKELTRQSEEKQAKRIKEIGEWEW